MLPTVPPVPKCYGQTQTSDGWCTDPHQSSCPRVSDRWLVAQSPEICPVSDVSDSQLNQHVSTILVDQFHVTSRKKYCGGQQEWFTHQTTLLELGLTIGPWDNSEVRQFQSSLGASDDFMCITESYRVLQRQAMGTRAHMIQGAKARWHCQALSTLVNPRHWGES